MPGQPHFSVLTHQAAVRVPAGAGVPIERLGVKTRFRPSEITVMEMGLEDPIRSAIVHGFNEQGAASVARLTEFPGIHPLGGDDVPPPELERALLFEIEHSKVAPGVDKSSPDDPPRTPEGSRRIIAVFDLVGALAVGETTGTTVFAAGELRPGHTNEGPDIYLGALVVGRRGPEPGAPAEFYAPDAPERGFRYFPLSAINPAMHSQAAAPAA
jgi:hypothetical protein